MMTTRPVVLWRGRCCPGRAAGSQCVPRVEPDRRVIELDLGRFDIGLIGLDRRFELLHQRCLRIDLLLRVGERPGLLVALEVQLRVFQLRLILGLGRFRKIERRLERTRIDLSKNIAGFDILAFCESTLLELPSTRVFTVTVLKACTVPRPVR